MKYATDMTNGNQLRGLASSQTPGDAPRLEVARRPRWCRASIWCLLLGLAFILQAVACSEARAQQVDIWEYSPYKVCIWLSIDPSVDRSELAQTDLIEQTRQELHRTFGAAWNTQFTDVPPQMSAPVARGIGELVVDDFTKTDLVLLLDKTNEDLKTLRVVETAVEQLEKIGITRVDHAQMLIDSQPFMEKDEQVQKVVGKSSEVFETYEELVAALKEKRISAALVPRIHLPMFDDCARALATTLAWHTERFLNDYEKLFVVTIAREDENYAIQVREMDCPMRQLGPVFSAQTATWQNLAQLVTTQTVAAFAPVARIEEVAGKLVFMLIRAGGLAEAPNPVLIQAGEVLQPVIRRDDRRGATVLMEPIPWTYIGVTKSDGIQLEGNSYSALGNVLQGKQTRRAQRVALRVRPTGQKSDVKVVVRSNLAEAQPGCQVFERDLLTDDMRFVGYTDWRGMITIDRTDQLGRMLPERVRMEQAAARRAAQVAADQAAMNQSAKQTSAESATPTPGSADAPASNATPASTGAPSSTDAAGATPAVGQEMAGEEDVRGSDGPGKSSEAKLVEGAVGTPGNLSIPAGAEPVNVKSETSSEAESAAVPLRQPLVLLYVKSGDTVLARLPLVPGLNEVDLADLPSDARRLEAEAHLRGFQNDILDLIGKRAILTSRVQQALKARNYKDAGELIEEVRALKDYKTLSDSLNIIQTRMLDESKEAVPATSKTRINRMVGTTREMLQKYLENDLVQKLLKDVEAAKAAAAAEDKAAEDEARAKEAQAKEDEAAAAKAAKAQTDQ
ncbi:MAG: hypothetical protein IT423_01755 [Pirellulaceae bacterium]|nr:hypothetical protein [Pirellulaceae bacterium]